MMDNPVIQDLLFGDGQNEGGERNGGPLPGMDGNIERDFDEAVDRVRRGYFRVDGGGPRYTEYMCEKRFRVPRGVFNRVYAKLFVHVFFTRKKDALGKYGLHLLQRIVGVFRMLAYGTLHDAMDELLRI